MLEFGEVRALMQRPPSEDVWWALVDLLGGLLPENKEEILSYCAGVMSHWPSDVRRPLDSFKFGDAGARSLSRVFPEACLANEFDGQGVSLTGKQLEALALEEALRGVTWLSLFGTKIHLPQASVLAGSPLLDGVRCLDLSECRLTAETLEVLLRAGLGACQELALLRNKLRDEGAAVLAAVSMEPAKLNVASNQIQGQGLRALWEGLRGFESLSLLDNHIKAADLEILGEGHPGLHTLSLALNKIGAAGARALAELPERPALRALDLSSCNLGKRAGAVLGQAPWLESVTSLRISNNGMSDEGLGALVSSRSMQGVTCLDVSYNELGDVWFQAMLDSEYLEALQTLEMRGFTLSRGEQARIRRARPGLTVKTD